MRTKKEDALARIDRVLDEADDALKSKFANALYKSASLAAHTVRDIAWEPETYKNAIPIPENWNHDGLLQLKGLLEGLRHAIEHGDLDLGA